MYYIFSKSNCPNCVKAKRLLDNYEIPYKVVDIEQDDEARNTLNTKGLRSVPQVFDDDILVGGYDKLFDKLVEEYQ